MKFWRPASPPDGTSRRAPPVGAVQDLVPPFQMTPEGILEADGRRWQMFALLPEPGRAEDPPRQLLRHALVDGLPEGMTLRLLRAARYEAAPRAAYLERLAGQPLAGSEWGKAYLEFLMDEPLAARAVVYGALGWPPDREAEARRFLAAAAEALSGEVMLKILTAEETLQLLGILARLEIVE